MNGRGYRTALSINDMHVLAYVEGCSWWCLHGPQANQYGYSMCVVQTIASVCQMHFLPYLMAAHHCGLTALYMVFVHIDIVVML